MKTVIIAAGMGSRLWDISDKSPKSLLPLGDISILETIVDHFSEAGLNDFVFVVGYEKEVLIPEILHLPIRGKLEIVENSQWKKGNGLSVLAARSVVGKEPFILSMSDHVVSSEALQLMKEDPRDENLLLVDPHPEVVFDIDDATKVKMTQERIVSIGKELKDYNAIDCGIFRLDDRFFQAMEAAWLAGEDSISAGVRRLIHQKQFFPVLLQEGQQWLDIDTPEAYAEAHKRFL